MHKTAVTILSDKQTHSKQFIPKRIVSGGQTGVDRAGLEMAIALGIEHGGWCPAGRLAEDGTVPSRYELQEWSSPEYPARTEQNVIDSDATLILYETKLKGGTLLTRKICRRLDKTHLATRMTAYTQDAAITQIREWLNSNRPATLNIAGPRESSFPGVFDRSFEFLMLVFTS